MRTLTSLVGGNLHRPRLFIYAAGSEIYIAGISLHSTVNCHNKFRHQGNESIIFTKIGGISRAIFSTVNGTDDDAKERETRYATFEVVDADEY